MTLTTRMKRSPICMMMLMVRPQKIIKEMTKKKLNNQAQPDNQKMTIPKSQMMRMKIMMPLMNL
jgi:hypothetical protein